MTHGVFLFILLTYYKRLCDAFRNYIDTIAVSVSLFYTVIPQKEECQSGFSINWKGIKVEIVHHKHKFLVQFFLFLEALTKSTPS